MEGLDLGKKVGPLPAGAWVLVVGAGLTVGYFINRNAGKKAAAGPVQVAESGTGVGGGSFLPIDAPSTSPAPDQTISDNSAWGRQALNWLISQQADPGTSDNAIRKYLYGENLSIVEQALLNRVLLKFGAPPERISPTEIPTATPPGAVNNLAVTSVSATSIGIKWDPVPGAAWYIVRTEEPAGPTPRLPDRRSLDTQQIIAPLGLNIGYRIYVYAENTAGKGPESMVAQKTDTISGVGFARAYTVEGGDTLSSIASRFYGNGSSTEVAKLYAANVGSIEAAARANGKTSSNQGFYLYPGTTLHIP